MKQEHIMKQEYIMDALNHVDENMIEEAAKARMYAMENGEQVIKKDTAKHREKRILKAAIAACICTAVIAGVCFLEDQNIDDLLGTGNDLPILDISRGGISSGMGDDGLNSGKAGIAEVDNGNPWRPEKQLETLPAFKNSGYYPHGGPASGLTEDEMEAKIYSAAEASDLKIVKIERVEDTDNYKGYDDEKEYSQYDGLIALKGYAEDVIIQVERNGNIFISTVASEPGEETRKKGILKLPQEWAAQVSYMTDSAVTEEQANELIDYLSCQCSDLLEFSDPQKITYVETDLTGTGHWQFQIYDKDQDYIQTLLNYNFKRADFYIEDGWLIHIRINDYLSVIEKAGDYPLITIEEAEEKLLTGEYNSISGNTSIDKEDVEKVELCYSTGIEDYLIPYYQFYVNEPYEGLKEGVKHYKICLVPAIEDRYISERDMS